MSKRSVAILIVAALALTGISLALSRRDSGDWRASQARRLFPFPWRDVASIRIERPSGETVDLAREPGEEWKIILANNRRDSLNHNAEEELSALVMLPWREPRENAARPDPARSARVSAASFAGEAVTLVIGPDENGGPPVVEIDGEPGVVFGIAPDLARPLDWPPERFRNLGLAIGGPGKRPVRIILSPGPALTVDLTREGNAWFLKSPVDWPAESGRIAYLLGWLDRLRADSIAADGVDDPEGFGFGPESIFVETHFEDESGRTVRRVEFGGQVDGSPDQLYARVNGREPLFTVSRFVFDEIGMNQAATHPSAWADFYRRRSLDLLTPGLPRRVTVERFLPVPERLVIERDEEDETKWMGTLEKGGTALQFPVDSPVADIPSRPLAALLEGLAGLRVRQFLADSQPGQETIKWTAFPAWRIASVGADGNENPALILYAADAEGNLPPGSPYVERTAGPVPLTPLSGTGDLTGMAASVEDRPVIVDVPGDLAYSLCLPPYRYRTRTMTNFDHGEWSRVAVEKGDSAASYSRGRGEQWRRDGERPEPLVDDNNRFLALLADLSHLRTSGIVAEDGGDSAEFGLDQPEITVIVYGTPEIREETPEDDGELRVFALSVGAGVEGGRYARLDDSGVVFLIPSELATAVAWEYR